MKKFSRAGFPAESQAMSESSETNVDLVASARRVLRTTSTAHIAIVAVMVVISAWAWWVLPGDVRIPVHWNMDFQPDRHGSKFEGLLLSPILATAAGILFAIIPFVDPRRKNLMRSFGAYHVVWLATVSLVAVVHIVTIGHVLGWALPQEAILLATALMFIAIGNVLGKVRSNHFFGVRTPWTLSSDEVWNKTNRMTGWVLVVLGASMLFTTCVLGMPGTAITSFCWALPFVALFAYVYSYWLWARRGRTESRG